MSHSVISRAPRHGRHLALIAAIAHAEDVEDVNTLVNQAGFETYEEFWHACEPRVRRAVAPALISGVPSSLERGGCLFTSGRKSCRSPAAWDDPRVSTTGGSVRARC